MDNITVSTLAWLNNTLADDNITVSNVTTSRPLPRTPPPVGYYGDIRIMLWKILPPIIMTWGITGNILSIIILFRLARRSSITSTTLYLTALALSDIMILLCGPLRNWINQIWEKDVRYYSEASCKSQLFFTYFSIHLSSWLLVAITMERVISVVFPHKVRTRCTPRIATIIIVVILIVIGGFSLIHPIIQGLVTSRSGTQCTPRTEEYTEFRDNIYVWMDFCLSLGAPFLFLLIGNIIIIIQLTQSKRTQSRMNASRGEGKRSGRDTRSLSILLISLSAIFLLTMTPVNVFAIAYRYKFEEIKKIKDPYKQWYDFQYLLYQQAIVNLVGYTNASFNFILYVLTGSKFRKELVDMFRCKLPKALRTTSNTPTSSTVTKQSSLTTSNTFSQKVHPADSSETGAKPGFVDNQHSLPQEVDFKEISDISEQNEQNPTSYVESNEPVQNENHSTQM